METTGHMETCLLCFEILKEMGELGLVRREVFKV
jgi:hypothetical protein